VFSVANIARMVAVSPSDRRPSVFKQPLEYLSRFFLSNNQVSTLVACFVGGMLLVQLFDTASPKPKTSQLRVVRSDTNADSGTCGLYLAKSAIPNGGLGVFVGPQGISKPNGPVGFPDVCIYVADTPKNLKQLRTHSYGYATFFGQFEGSNSRAACEGLATLMNTMVSTSARLDLPFPT
jgi:hypothetical protein